MEKAPLNLMKLSVGTDTVDDLAQWQQRRFGNDPAVHVTRMWPKRGDEILSGGGSLFWVIKGAMLVRQPLLALEERIGEDGIRRCALILERNLIPVTATPRRAFQGWRYLKGEDAPRDLPQSRGEDHDLPPKLAAELAEMGLL